MDVHRVSLWAMISTVILLLPKVYGNPHLWNAAVEIMDDLGGPTLNFQCQSARTIFLPIILRENQTFQWNFEPQDSNGIFTQYSCEFGWNQKTASFPVWNKDLAKIAYTLCKWKVEESGFSVYNPAEATWEHKHAWGDHTLIADLDGL